MKCFAYYHTIYWHGANHIIKLYKAINALLP